MQLVNRKNLIIAGGVVVLLIVIGGLFALQLARNSSSNKTADGTDTQTVDKNSGETVSNIAGKTPETFGLLPDAPIYLNIAAFTDRGLSDSQLSSLKYAFYQYATSQNPKIKQVSITKDSLQSYAPDDSGKATIDFNVVFDTGPKMNGTLVRFNDSIELTINDASGKKVFESGTVTDKSIEIQ